MFSENMSESGVLGDFGVGRSGMGERRMKNKKNRNGKGGLNATQVTDSKKERTCWCFGP